MKRGRPKKVNKVSKVSKVEIQDSVLLDDNDPESVITCETADVTEDKG